MTPSQLWKRMKPEERVKVARAFWQADDAASDQVQAILLISQQKNFRPKTVAALDDDRKTRHLASLSSVPDLVASRALVAYHLAEERPMMGAFLDALGITHENGLIQDEPKKPEASKLEEAAARLAEQYPSSNVSLYFDTLVAQDPETWSGLEQLAKE